RRRHGARGRWIAGAGGDRRTAGRATFLPATAVRDAGLRLSRDDGRLLRGHAGPAGIRQGAPAMDASLIGQAETSIARAASWIEQHADQFSLRHSADFEEALQLLKPIGELTLTLDILARCHV